MSISLLAKAENPQAYKDLVAKGIMVGHPVSFGGKAHRDDTGTKYHVTIKASDRDLSSTTEMHQAAQKANFPGIDPKTTGIEPGTFKDRFGNDVYMIKLLPQDDSLKQANSHFAHIKQFKNYDFTPHVSVDAETWHKIKASSAKTAHEAGMEFGPAKLFQGDKELATYHPKPVKEEPLAASETSDLEPLNKSLKHLATAAAMASALGIPVANPATKQTDVNHHYDRQSMLNAISQVESSGGKFVNHRELHGAINEGERAAGKFALTPATIRETVKMHPELKQKYGKAANLHGPDMNRFVQDNPDFEQTVANKHIERLEHHFGKNPDLLGFSWLNGITGTKQAVKEGQNISEHWHVRKIRSAYKGPQNRYSSN